MGESKCIQLWFYLIVLAGDDNVAQEDDVQGMQKVGHHHAQSLGMDGSTEESER